MDFEGLKMVEFAISNLRAINATALKAYTGNEKMKCFVKGSEAAIEVIEGVIKDYLEEIMG